MLCSYHPQLLLGVGGGRARTVVLVPPEETRIKAIGAPPLLVSELTSKPVQVAEPLGKA